MSTLERVKQVEKAKAFVEFALQKLDDVWNVEAALLSGATSLSEASNPMVSVKSMLGEIQLVLINAALESPSVPCLEDDYNKQVVSPDLMEWITAVADICICTERALFDFWHKAGRTIPFLPEAVKRISTKPVDLFALNRLAIEMRKIQSQLYNITNHDALMYLTNHNHADATLQAFPPPALSSPLLNNDETDLVGYEALQKSIIDKLLDPSIPELLQVAILGPEAAGKTTLAQKIYQRIVAKNHFDVCFWLFDMNRFNYQRPELFKPIDIFRMMLITLEPGNSSDDHDEKVVIQRIHESLKEKRYLVVIDNVQRYNIFKKALPSENNGSRVLIACQEMGNFERICLDLDPEIKYQLPSLSYEERLKLIFRKPFEKKDTLEEYPPDFLPTASIIAASCFGDSPMNLLLLSGHILFNQPFSHNFQVLGDIAAADNFSEFLTIIYNKLPILLRTCFTYMAALFPINYLIHANSLIRLWIAEGMILKEDERTLEQTADLYLDELIQRGFVRSIWANYHNQPNQPIRVVTIHPMLQSGLFDIYTGINNCPPIKVILGDDAVDIFGYYGEGDDNHANLEPLRRLALHCSYENDQFSSFQEGKARHGFKYPSLHSLFFFGSVAPLMFSEFVFLRVFTVFNSRIRFCEEDRSCWLEGLINLRYLGFIVCWVEGGSLGNILSRLTNLKTLDLSESSVSGISEFMEHNTKVTVIGPIKEELHGCWSPIPDMTQLTCQQ
ncbi:putative disease resistance RPP13-like protein 2 [Carex rostrata]